MFVQLAIIQRPNQLVTRPFPVNSAKWAVGSGQWAVGQALVSGHRSGDGKCFSNLFPCFTWPTSNAYLAVSFSSSSVFVQLNWAICVLSGQSSCLSLSDSLSSGGLLTRRENLQQQIH